MFSIAIYNNIFMAIYPCPGLCVHVAFNPLYILILILIVANNVQSF